VFSNVVSRRPGSVHHLHNHGVLHDNAVRADIFRFS